MSTQSIIKKTNKKLSEIIHEDLPILKEVKKFVVKSGGKRIRPITHYYFSRILDYRGDEWADVGAIGEMIHAASLLHDDVVDKASTRRGKPTVGALHGNKTAILTGDYLLSCALDHVAHLSHPVEFLRIFTRVLRMLTVGELLQMEWENNLKVSEKVYDRILLGKTGSLFGAMTETAAVFSGKKEEELVDYRLFGEKMGYAFQIRDDFLDYFGDPEKERKDPFQDFKRGIVTRPILVLRKKAGLRQRKRLQELWLEDEKRNSDEGVKFMAEMMEEHSVRKLVAQEIEITIHELMQFLRKHPSSSHRDSIMEHLEKLMVPVE